jgi:hypothetical protein
VRRGIGRVARVFRSRSLEVGRPDRLGVAMVTGVVPRVNKEDLTPCQGVLCEPWCTPHFSGYESGGRDFAVGELGSSLAS